MNLRITPLTGTVGAAIEGVDLKQPIAPETFAGIEAAFLKHCMLVFRNQHLQPADQLAFARMWGEPVVTPMLGKLQHPEHPEVVRITRIPKATSSSEAWHYDGPFTPVPPKLSILSAQIVPRGGDTMWTNQYVAYDRLSEGMKRMLHGVRVHFRGLRLARQEGIPDDKVPHAVHPLIRTHPVTGGKVKMQWKPDFGMRWAALGVDFEMFGKDHQPNQQVYARICKALGAEPPVNYVYELFLDQHGEKISKTKGNGISVEQWLSYAAPESLSIPHRPAGGRLPRGCGAASFARQARSWWVGATSR